ncbi:GDSL-like Lipase/Acylhydrolase-domain-containing protein [Chytridium lagenaria]|nr:GDSL-like Lipase/Acylhydrolase-domain-containing protein [Chytridium lagenaria]
MGTLMTASLSLLLLLLHSIAVTSFPAPCQNPFSLTVLGDSWSDNGNVNRLTNNTWPLPSSYCSGRFSNGLVWNEYLSYSYGLKLTNLAYGGATTNNTAIQGYTGVNSTIPVPSITDQSQTFLSSPSAHRSIASRNHIVAIWVGGNDAFFGETSGAAAAQRVIATITNLSMNGVKRFLIFHLPPLDSVPYLSDKPTLRDFFITYGQDYNLEISAYAMNSPLSIRVVPMMGIYEKLSAMYQVKTTACVDATTLGKCGNPGEYVYWDAFHFTTGFHEKIAEAVAELIKDWLPVEKISKSVWTSEVSDDVRTCAVGVGNL